MKFRRKFKGLGKSLFSGLIGSIAGLIIAIFYVLVIWINSSAQDVGLAIIVVLPIMIVLFALLGIIVGGVLGILIYWIFRFFRKRK